MNARACVTEDNNRSVNSIASEEKSTQSGGNYYTSSSKLVVHDRNVHNDVRMCEAKQGHNVRKDNKFIYLPSKISMY